MDVDKLDFVSTPIWIQLINLKWRFWTRKGLSKLASYVGLPITMDKLTKNRARLGYTRILVEVNIKGVLPSTIPITDPNGNVFEQPVVYEHLMPKCGTCGFIGHLPEQCRKTLPERNIEPPKKFVTIVLPSCPQPESGAQHKQGVGQNSSVAVQEKTKGNSPAGQSKQMNSATKE